MDNVTYKLDKQNRKNKENFLNYLFTLEKQEMLNNQELAFASPQKDD